MGKVSRNFSGTPWHIEKVKGEGIRDNTNCVFNDKGRCSCIISCNHNNACVGKVVCEEFEYGIANKKVNLYGLVQRINQRMTRKTQGIRED